MIDWWMKRMELGETVSLSDTANLSEEASCLSEVFIPLGVRAVIGMPINLNGRLYGYVGFAVLGATHQWTQQEEQVLRIFSELITNWLSRESTLEALRESEEQFRNLAEQSPNMIFINQGGRVVYANRECEVHMGYTREEFYSPGFNFISLIHPSSRLLVQQNFQRHLQGEDMDAYEYHLQRKDDSIISAIIASKLITYRQKPALMGIVTDITARKAMEEQLRQTNADLEQFVYVASHDLQEPLRGISSYMELLQEQYAPRLDGKGRLFVERAGLAAGRLQSMIDGLLAYSRITRRDVPDEQVNLDALLDEVISTMPAVQKARLHREPLPTVRGDSSQLQSVLRNLLSNAVKYCEREPELRLGSRREGDRHVIWLQDNGIGIKDVFFEEVFDIFRRLHNYDHYPGSGIGLATSRKIVERHGGAIRVESSSGEGTTFVMELPAADRRPAQNEPEKP